MGWTVAQKGSRKYQDHKLINMLNAQQEATLEQIAFHLDVQVRTAAMYVDELRAEGKIQRHPGTNKGRPPVYKINVTGAI